MLINILSEKLVNIHLRKVFQRFFKIFEKLLVINIIIEQEIKILVSAKKASYLVFQTPLCNRRYGKHSSVHLFIIKLHVLDIATTILSSC